MHPRNVGCLSTAGINACALANNHVMDWGHAGLIDTLQTLDAAGIAHAGAGENADEAAAPAVVNVTEQTARASLFHRIDVERNSGRLARD